MQYAFAMKITETEEFIMRTKHKKAMVLLNAVCILAVLATGCSFSPAPAANTAAAQTPEELNGTQPTDTAGSAGSAADTEKPQENAEGKWHVLDAETADAVDADFMGKVWEIAEGAFSIAEIKVQLLDDGSIASSAPGSNADIPDSQLVHVIIDEDTYFYVRTIYGSGESYEDAEAGFQDLEEHMSVELKGSFENDVFYATEVRMVKVS